MSQVSGPAEPERVAGGPDDDIPPESWPGAGGRKSVAPRPGSARTAGSDSWPGANPARSARSARPARPVDEADLETLRLRPPAHRVDPRAKGAWMLVAGLGWLVPLAALCAWVVLDEDHRAWQIGALAAVLVLAIAHILVMPQWRFRVHRWEVTDEAVYTQEGWWRQERRLAPIARVQTVDSERGPIERLFGLGTVTVTTASAAGPLRIAGLDQRRVDEIVAGLTRVAARDRGDAT